LVVAVLVAASAVGVLVRRRNGKFREISTNGPAATGEATPDEPAGSNEPSGNRAEETVSAALAGLGVTAHTPVTLLQFSSAFCAPCRTTRVLCADVAATLPGVTHLDVDAESHLDAVRALDIWRTPTVLIVDGQGQVRRRASGAPTRAQLVAAVAELLPRSDLGTTVTQG
jgi:thiol-disulfide isomerase/thioredoxin